MKLHVSFIHYLSEAKCLCGGKGVRRHDRLGYHKTQNNISSAFSEQSANTPASMLKQVCLQEFHKNGRPELVNNLYIPPSCTPHHRTKYESDVWMLGITFAQLCNMHALCEHSSTHKDATASLQTPLRPPLFRPPTDKEDESHEELVNRWCADPS
jgi:hypothetical protein